MTTQNSMNTINSKIDKIIIVDPGKNTVNALCFDSNFNLIGHVAFPSVTQRKRSFRDIDSSSDLQFQVEYQDEKFLVGEGILTGFNFETSKNTMHHKICIDTAIAYFVDNNNERIHLVVGYPSSDYTNPEQQEEYIKLIKENTGHIVVNGEEKSFIITDVVVKPEGVAMKPRIQQVPGQKVKVIDIGGENINYRYYDEKGNTLESESLDKLGVNHLESFIKTKLRKYVKVKDIDVNSIDYLKAVSDCKIDEVLDQDISDFENSHEFMREVVLDFVDMIIDGLDAKGVSLYRRGTKFLFTGGGSMLLKPYLEETLKNSKDYLVFSNTAYWDNCISYAIKDVGDRYKAAPGDIKENMQLAQIVANKMLKEADHLAIS